MTASWCWIILLLIQIFFHAGVPDLLFFLGICLVIPHIHAEDVRDSDLDDLCDDPVQEKTVVGDDQNGARIIATDKSPARRWNSDPGGWWARPAE